MEGLEGKEITLFLKDTQDKVTRKDGILVKWTTEDIFLEINGKTQAFPKSLLIRAEFKEKIVFRGKE